ncbi:hypothetical protein WKI13_06275 [Teredinibacter turnerae]|uniref:hypothetical protein n=1 Tax=Teredinibacter turnerae TaxID=2426 RepID=UPI00036E431E|nr:hypothetical protein [Teredinibacter turnerae]
MTNVRELSASFNDWEMRYILESLQREMERLKKINAESEDEDEAADAGNDFLELSGLFDSLAAKAVEVFGEQILDFSNALV